MTHFTIKIMQIYTYKCYGNPFRILQFEIVMNFKKKVFIRYKIKNTRISSSSILELLYNNAFYVMENI